MKFIILFGPPAVGKMTVGMELAKLTGLKLLHNHMTIELVLNFFDWQSPQFSLSNEFRMRIFEEFASSDLDGLIFTFVWSLDEPSDKEYIDKACSIFREQSAEIYFVELYADIATRLERNTSPLRLEHKASKRDTEHSKQNILKFDKKYKLNSNNDFFYEDNYLRIDNSNKSAAAVATEIAAQLDL